MQLQRPETKGQRQVETGCNLDDQPSCPRVRSMRLTSQEVESMRTLAESSDHRHMSLRALALHAQRIGKVVASQSTSNGLDSMLELGLEVP